MPSAEQQRAAAIIALSARFHAGLADTMPGKKS
jgi:hypothetical protein